MEIYHSTHDERANLKPFYIYIQSVVYLSVIGIMIGDIVIFGTGSTLPLPETFLQKVLNTFDGCIYLLLTVGYLAYGGGYARPTSHSNSFQILSSVLQRRTWSATPKGQATHLAAREDIDDSDQCLLYSPRDNHDMEYLARLATEPLLGHRSRLLFISGDPAQRAHAYRAAVQKLRRADAEQSRKLFWHSRARLRDYKHQTNEIQA